MAVWADDDEIVCVHPGGPRVIGPAAIRASFEAIFANGPIPVQPEQVHRLRGAVGGACTTWSSASRCSTRRGSAQRLGGGHQCLPARPRCGWRLVAHHASPGSLRAAGGSDAPAGDAALSGRAAIPARPRWLPGGHLQTIWPALLVSRRPRRPRCTSGASAGTRPTATSSTSTLRCRPRPAIRARRCWCCSTAWKARRPATMRWPSRLEARRRGWAFAVPHFRGCSGELNRAPRAYHSGDFEEVGWILAAAARAPRRGRCWRSASRWAAMRCCAGPRRPATAPRATARAVAAICAPLDLAASGAGHRPRLQPARSTRACSCATMKPKALAKWQQHPGLFDRERLAAARTLYEFDNVFTAPLHGFRDTDDYWARASAKPHLHAHPHPGAGAERAQRPLRAGRRRCRGRPRSAPSVDAVAAGARRPCRASRRAASRAMCRRCPSRRLRLARPAAT